MESRRSAHEGRSQQVNVYIAYSQQQAKHHRERLLSPGISLRVECKSCRQENMYVSLLVLFMSVMCDCNPDIGFLRPMPYRYLIV